MVLMITLAAVSGLVAAGGMYQHVLQVRGDAPGGGVRVAVARRDLPRGTRLTLEALDTARMSLKELPPGTFSDPRTLVGRLLADSLPQGAPVREDALMPLAAHPPLMTAVPPGYRAVGVFVDGRGGLHRFLQPGDRVDVVVAVASQPNADTAAARILVQDVQILNVPESRELELRPGATGIPVTLAVTPADAEKLALAMQVGAINLLLRGLADERMIQTSGVTQDTLLPRQGPHVLSAERPSADRTLTFRAVEVIKGRERQQQRFSESDASSVPAPGAESGAPAAAPLGEQP
jgi:pilus assembly protein CpaB